MATPKKKAPKKVYSVPDQHQRKIAKQTLRYSDAGARIMGGPTKDEARKILGKALSSRIENSVNGTTKSKVKK